MHSFLHFSGTIDVIISVITPKKISYGSPRKWSVKLHKMTSYTWNFQNCFSQFLWNLTFIFSGSHKKFSLLLLHITNYIKNVTKNATWFKLFRYKVFVQRKLKLLNFLMDSVLIILPTCQIIIMWLSAVSAVVNPVNSGYVSTF